MTVSTSFRSIMRILIMLAFVVTVPGSMVVYSQYSISNTQNTNQLSLQKQPVAGVLVEEFSFLIKDFKIDHQGESNVLNISISYRYAANIANSDTRTSVR